MNKATRPLEYICFFQAEFPTRDDGDVYAFIFVDAHSEFARVLISYFHVALYYLLLLKRFLKNDFNPRFLITCFAES